MAYTSVMVHLELGRSNAALLKATQALAQRFNARVLGVAAGKPMQMVYSETYMSGELIEQEQKLILAELQKAEAEFRAALAGSGGALEWRSRALFASLSDYIVSEARSADLLVTSANTSGVFDASRAVDTGDLVLQAGRPVLVVPEKPEDANLDQVLVAWKDSREARRAVVDALPLLQTASRVVVAELAADVEMEASHKRLADVVVWLKGHGVASAEALTVLSTGKDAEGLDIVADEQGIGLIVAGGYGHGRLREWALGGVTRDLLKRTHHYLLLSH